MNILLAFILSFSITSFASDSSAIVKISFMNKYIGTGLIIGKNRILTPCHVIKSVRSNRKYGDLKAIHLNIRNKENLRFYVDKIEKCNNRFDLALLTSKNSFQVTPLKMRKITKEFSKFSSVKVAGFCGGRYEEAPGRLSKLGLIKDVIFKEKSMSKVKFDALEVNTKICNGKVSGTSGSSVFLKHGKLLGLVIYKDSKDKTLGIVTVDQIIHYLTLEKKYTNLL